MSYLIKIIKFVIVVIFITNTTNAQVFDVPFNTDAPTRTLLVPVQNPKAVVLLFPGGPGVLKLQDNGWTNNRHTFVRSKELWAKYGIDAVLVDTPYDLGRGPNNIRASKDHQQRIFTVVKYYKEKFNLPVWIFGHSMGTVSVSEFANTGKEQQQIIKGVIIAGTYGSVTMNEDGKLPVLAIHHTQDTCLNTPISTSEAVIKSRPKDSRSQFILIDGGISTGNVCDAFAYHGFNETEDQFIKSAAEFILKK